MPALTEVQPGDALPGRTVHLDRARLIRYAGASGDFNPIHWDERTATGVGLPDVIAHGMLTMGAAMQVVVDWAGDAGRVVSCATRFSGMVPVPHDGGAEVEVTGAVKSVDAGAGTATVEIAATCDGAKVLSRASAIVRLD